MPATTPFLLCFLYFRRNRKQHTQTIIREAHGSAQCAKQRLQWLELGAASREPRSGDRLKKSQLALKPGAKRVLGRITGRRSYRFLREDSV